MMRRGARLRAKRGGRGREPYNNFVGRECDPSCDAAAAADPAAPPTSPPSSDSLPPPPPPLAPPPEGENLQGPSGEGEPESVTEDGADSGAEQGETPAEEPSGGSIGFFRGLQRSLGRQLPGGACVMARGGSRRKSKDERLDQCRDWLRATLKNTGIFMTRADSRIWIILGMAGALGILHWYYLTYLFENDRHFSHLSTLEREMSFRTEMGLYYSYFKTIVEAPSFWNGLCTITSDRLVEYPLVINTLKRFNLYPEVVLAFMYRFFKGTMDVFGIEAMKCWTVNRGEGLSPVESCEGVGDPASFYVGIIFLLNGLMVSAFFLYGTYLSGSRLGGLLTVACFFFNHGESTRVMWTPPLRESFSYPFLVVQMLALTSILRAQTVDRGSLIALSISNVFFMLPWQFAQFVLLTQVMSVFAIYVVGFIDSCKLLKILYAHMASLVVCFILMFGNAMLLTSYYAASLAVCWGILEVCPKYLNVCRSNTSVWALEGATFLIGTVVLKSLMCLVFGIADDAHISNLLRAKLLGYRDFDTAMYLCAVEFDFMEKETPIRYLKTLLLPLVVFIFGTIVWTVFQHVSVKKSTQRQMAPFKQGEMVYLAIQLMAFTFLAILIMRLKLFLTPHMCIMASLIFSKQLFGWLFAKISPVNLAIVIFAIMAFEGSANIKKEMNITGEFANYPQEELLLWIQKNTRKDAVFAGAMPTMASVKLSTLRPIVNHPHYEDADLRARTKIVYSMFSRKPAREVKNNLLKLGVNYYILEDSWCLRRTGPGCSLPEIWDLEDLANAGKPPLCTLMSKDPRPYFRPVFSNSMYKVLEVTRE